MHLIIAYLSIAFVVFIGAIVKSNIEANSRPNRYRLLIREPIIVIASLIIGLGWLILAICLVIVSLIQGEQNAGTISCCAI